MSNVLENSFRFDEYWNRFRGLGLNVGRISGSLERRATIPDIPGPPSPSGIFCGTPTSSVRALLILRCRAHAATASTPTDGDYEFTWQKLYRPVYLLKWCFEGDCLIVSDPVS
ncbi:hypothetical protein B0H10DRAFT_2282936 [Mycena sp. CBHHK59/15]|nr:hypothetical protein B0H10DRAFT_2282936 [Mycena sp. CBHHK59/15]